ncbi:MAG: ATP-binding protein [bacterium]
MSLQSLLSTNIFKVKKTIDPPLAAVEKLFLYVVDQIEDKSSAENSFGVYLEARQKQNEDQIFALVRAYYACESHIKDKISFRENVRSKISIESLNPKLRLIFLGEPEQALLLYEQFSLPFIEYLATNLGVTRVERIIQSQRAFPALRGISLNDRGIDFSKLDNFLFTKGEVQKKDIDNTFSFFYNLLLTEISVLFSDTVASALVKKVFDTVKSAYDYDIISVFLNVVPENDLETERLTFLSRDELEAKVRERTFLLKQEKERVDQKVRERTHELEDERSKLAIITENMNEGTILFDEDRRVMYVNTRAWKLLSVDQIGSNNSLEFIADAFTKKFMGINIKVSFDKVTPSEPYTIPEIDVDERVYKITFTFLQNEKDSNRNRSLIWIEDITESKILERKKSEFVSVVAHQLRTPLSGIKWTLHMLTSGDLGPLTDDQKNFIGKAYDSNDRMIDLINDMLSVDRIVSGHMQFFYISSQILDIVDSVMYELNPTAHKRNVTISFKDRPISLPKINMDPEKIRAVVQNLIENAIKYTKEGGTVLVRAIDKNDTIHIEIEDSGIGIPPAEQGSIFSRFFRGSNALRVQTDGSGLGLFIAKSIVESHHGSIGFKSELGKGTVFYFDIPKDLK